MNANERYTPNGKPLTPYEREVLTILVEECGEVIQAATKLLRFGKENRPDNGAPNTEVLSTEVGHVREVINFAIELKLVSPSVAEMAKSEKRRRLHYYMQTDPTTA